MLLIVPNKPHYADTAPQPIPDNTGSVATLASHLHVPLFDCLI